MQADTVLGVGALIRNFDLPYVSLLIDVGSTRDYQPYIGCYESDQGKQLSISIRGLLPSHILGLKAGEAASVDKDFSRFVASPQDPLDQSQVDKTTVQHSQSDLYSIHTDAFIQEHAGTLLSLYEHVKARWITDIPETVSKGVAKLRSSEISGKEFHKLFQRLRQMQKTSEPAPLRDPHKTLMDVDDD